MAAGLNHLISKNKLGWKRVAVMPGTVGRPIPLRFDPVTDAVAHNR